MTTSLNSDGFIPCLLVFSVLPRLPALSNLPKHASQMDANATERREEEMKTFEVPMSRALRTNLPSPQDLLFKQGDAPLVHHARVEHLLVAPLLHDALRSS